MKDTLSTIERLIKEHKEIGETIQACELFTNDLEQARRLDDARESLVPGRLEDHKKRAAQLERELMAVDSTLKQHFYCEEESLLSAFESESLPELASILSKLVAEHETILKHVAGLKKQAAELAADQLSLGLWHEKAWRMRKEMFNIHQLIKDHASREEALFREARKTLQERST